MSKCEVFLVCLYLEELNSVSEHKKRTKQMCWIEITDHEGACLGPSLFVWVLRVVPKSHGEILMWQDKIQKCLYGLSVSPWITFQWQSLSLFWSEQYEIREVTFICVGDRAEAWAREPERFTAWKQGKKDVFVMFLSSLGIHVLPTQAQSHLF